jgi:hypothetical protein
MIIYCFRSEASALRSLWRKDNKLLPAAGLTDVGGAFRYPCPRWDHVPNPAGTSFRRATLLARRRPHQQLRASFASQHLIAVRPLRARGQRLGP